MKRKSVSITNVDIFLNKVIGNYEIRKVKKLHIKRTFFTKSEIAEILFNSPLSLNALKKDYDEYKLGDYSKQIFNHIKSYVTNSYKDI